MAIRVIAFFFGICLVFSSACAPATVPPQGENVSSVVAPPVSSPAVIPTPAPSSLPSTVPTPSPSPDAAAEYTSPETPDPEDTPVFKPLTLDTAEAIIHVPADQPTIQQAIKQSANGDAILVAPGTYVENIDLLGKSIIVTSESGPDKTIIDGGRIGSVVTFWNYEDSNTVLHGFTITNGLVGGDFPFGGGISIRNASPIIVACRIMRNGSEFIGGGIFIEGSEASPKIENNAIYNNIATERGGGIEIRNGATPIILENAIIDNITMNGSAIDIADNASPLVENNTISQNKAGWDFSGEHAVQYLDGVDIIDHPSHTRFPSSIIVAQHCSPTISNNNINDNTGGGISILVHSSPLLENNLISGNQGHLLLAGGVLVALDCRVKLNSNTIKDNQNGAIWTDNTSTITGDNFIFGEVKYWPPTSVPEIEPVSNSTMLVPEEYITIQEAIRSANDGDTIIVSPGDYKGNIDFLGKDITLRSQNPNDLEIVESTLISPEFPKPTVSFNSWESRKARLEGFTIVNGFGKRGIEINYSSPIISKNIIKDCTGGGIECYHAPSPLITDNTIINNEAERGGAITCELSSPVISNNVFTGNIANNGSALNTYFAFPNIINNTISNNQARGVATLNIDHFSTGMIKGNVISGNTGDSFAGGIYLDCFTNCTIDSNIIIDNKGSPCGGIALFLDCYPEITNNIIARNDGGGIIVFYSSPKVVNNTVVDNTNSGIWAYGNSVVEVKNCILWNNGGDLNISEHSNVLTNYSDVKMNRQVKGNGNISEEPQFLGDGDYHLRPNSPCIDNGTDAGITTDLDGTERPQGDGFDIGAYEYKGRD